MNSAFLNQGFSFCNIRLLVHSLCPSIYGHELVKAALLMALFGGLVRGEDASVSSIQSSFLF